MRAGFVCREDGRPWLPMNEALQTVRFISLPNSSLLTTAPAQQLAGFTLVLWFAISRVMI
jgi:hypothetical protein